MACFVKLKDDCYILWSKAGECPAERKLFSQAEVLAELKSQHEVLTTIGRPPVMSPEAILTWLESYGTTDLGKGVDKEFIAEFNSLGPNETTLTIPEIIKLLTK